MKKLKKSIIAITLIIALLILNTGLMINCVKAANVQEISQVDLHSTGYCGQLLKYKGVIVTTYYVEYTLNGVSYPAYCIDKTLQGVEDGFSYAVTPNGVINDIGLWRTIINGYPYKSIEELGVANEKEAFFATKQAIYCYLYENTPQDYEAIGEAGQRTLNALYKIVTDAQNSTETQATTRVSVNTQDKTWEQDKTNKSYVSKTYSFTSNASHTDYNIQLNGDVPEGTIITNTQGIETNKFSGTDKFKIMIPIQNLKQDGTFKIDVTTQVKTKPVIYGASPNAGWQNYALTAYMYEDANTSYTDTYNKNQTQIIIKKQDEATKNIIKGAEFTLLDNKQNVLYEKLTTDENGEIKIQNLMPGTYYIKETKAPEGYETYDKLIEIEVSLNETKTVIVDNKKVEIPEEPQEPEVPEVKILPITGM